MTRCGVNSFLNNAPAADAQIARSEPLRAALEADDGVVIERMVSSGLGFDASNGKYVDLFEAGIIDATKVVRCALENAVSVAGTLLLTEATMIDVPDPESPQRSSAMAGGAEGLD